MAKRRRLFFVLPLVFVFAACGLSSVGGGASTSTAGGAEGTGTASASGAGGGSAISSSSAGGAGTGGVAATTSTSSSTSTSSVGGGTASASGAGGGATSGSSSAGGAGAGGAAATTSSAASGSTSASTTASTGGFVCSKSSDCAGQNDCTMAFCASGQCHLIPNDTACQFPPPCHESPAYCTPSGCSYTIDKVGGNPCPGGACVANLGCVPCAEYCPPPLPCQVLVCANGGALVNCTYPSAPQGTSCPGGTCDGNGACL